MRPRIDPTPIFDLFRGSYATEILTAAVAHFRLFERLPLRLSELGLAERPALVLTTALRAMGLLTAEGDRLVATPIAQEHLVRGAPFDISGYIGLAASSPGVQALIERLTTNQPVSGATGTAFIFREGLTSAMDQEESARHFTLALAGRANNVAPVLAERYPLDGARVLLDVGGGTGIYAIAWLKRHPGLRAIVWDRPEVLKVAAEQAASHGVADRLECRAGDMFTDEVPAADVVLLSNILHDWDVPRCRALLRRLVDALPAGGRLLVHDVFLDDDLGGPLPVALYSAALFTLTEGRAYSAAEYRAWLRELGLKVGEVVTTLVHCGVLAALK